MIRSNDVSAPAIADILSQHAEGASFLWHIRTHAVLAPHYNLSDLAKLDQRLEANLDGLQTAGNAGWEICREALREGESGEVFAAAVLALESSKEDRITAVFEAGAASPELARGLVSALGWLPFPQAEPQIRQLLASTSVTLQRVGIAASAIHRQNSGAPLLDALSATDPLLRARALSAVGELGLTSALPALEKHLADEGDLCRFWAAWSVALLSADAQALASLRAIAESNVPYREKALQVAIRRMDAAAAGAWRDQLAQDPKRLRIAIVAAGAFGDPANVPWLMEQMKVPQLARVAGEAFTMITGVDIAYQDLDAKKPEGFEAGPTENPEDEDVAMDPDDNLPWPAPESIAKWWTQHKGEFQKGIRYLLGQPVSVGWCHEVLSNGRQRQRAAAAIEISLRQSGSPLFNVAAPGSRQQELLGFRRRARL